MAEASRVHEKSWLEASGDALLNERFQRNDLALKVRTVLDA
jgi:hypothetical protein